MKPDGDEMKTSAQIFSELEAVLGRIRRLQAEAVAKEPLRLNRRLSDAEKQENERRSNRADQITIEIASSNAEAAQLRAAYAEAMASEQKPKPSGPSPALQALHKRRDDKMQRLERLGTERAEYALKAAEGDAEATKSLSKCCEDQARIATELENLALAIGRAEERDAEERRESADRDADEKHRAGLAAAEKLIAWAERGDNHLSYLANHLAELPELQKALMKSGAGINTDMTNRLFIKAAYDRAAKAKGLQRFFTIDATVDAAPLGDTYKKILKAAVRRPDKERLTG
jgi:hypothetical protein